MPSPLFCAIYHFLDTDVSDLKEVNKDKNVLVDINSQTSKTGDSGEALFSIKVLKGMESVYELSFQA